MQQIGKGPAECQLGLWARGGRGGGLQSGEGGAGGYDRARPATPSADAVPRVFPLSQVGPAHAGHVTRRAFQGRLRADVVADLLMTCLEQCPGSG